MATPPSPGTLHFAPPVNPLPRPSIHTLPRYQTLGNLPAQLVTFLERALTEEKAPLLPWGPTTTPAHYFEEVTQRWVNRHFPDTDLTLTFTDHEEEWYCTTGAGYLEYHDFASSYLWLETVEKGFFKHLLQHMHYRLNRVYPIYSPVSAAYHLEASRWDGDYDQFVQWSLEDYCERHKVSMEEANMEHFWETFKEQHWTQEDVFEQIPQEFFKHTPIPEKYFQQHLEHRDLAIRLLSQAAGELSRLEALLPEEVHLSIEDETQAPFAALYDLDFTGGDSYTVEMYREEEEMLMNSGEEREFFNCLPLNPDVVDQHLSVAGQMMHWVRTIERTLKNHGNPDPQSGHPAL